MTNRNFLSETMCDSHKKWDRAVSREMPLYTRENDARSAFIRDYNRILHSTAYRRLKHKTQVFFASENDHICTRIEHVNHVASISWSIAERLGLNFELVLAISAGHDLGHAPFGHVGERILSQLAERYLGEKFWHEKNSLIVADVFETLPAPDGTAKPLNLTYAVRDGIICHCGELDESGIYPREEVIDLKTIKKAGEVQPYTWEGCVVKISDKIAYLGRDIEDAWRLSMLNEGKIQMLSKKIETECGIATPAVNNTVLIHEFVNDLCLNSTPINGIGFSKGYAKAMEVIKDFCYVNIYKHERLDVFTEYAEMMLKAIFNKLRLAYSQQSEACFNKEKLRHYPMLQKAFGDWLGKYTSNQHVYEKEYIRLILQFLSGMTDSFSIKLFNELIEF